MSPSAPSSPRDAALQEALTDHRAGRLAAAEKAYRALIETEPGHAGANHHLGVLLVQTGRVDDGLIHLRSALNINGAEPLYYFSLAKGLLAARSPAEAGAIVKQAMQRGLADSRFQPLKSQIRDCAVAAYRQALTLSPDDAMLLDNLGSALFAQGKIEEAIACYRKALAKAPDYAAAHFHLGAVLSQNGWIAEGFDHYRRCAALGGMTKAAEDEPVFKLRHDQAQREYLAQAGMTDANRIAGPAVNPVRPALLEAWQAGKPQMVVVDDFLTPGALESLRGFCAGAKIWRKIYPAGYLGAAPEDGFACPLLVQIIEEIQSIYGAILNGQPFRYLGAFKYDSEISAGTNIHADNSTVNVNLYIAPDDANLDPGSGGMEIWDVDAPDIQTMRKLNGSEAMVCDFLAQAAGERFTVAHRANRAVIFRSTQFHKTDRFRFKTGYLSQRINISFLFGQFGEED